MTKSLVFRVFNIVFAILFIIAAALQYNDPDPYIWMVIYLFAALMCVMAIRGRFYPASYTAAFIILGAYAVYLFFDKTGVLNWANEHSAENIAQSMKATKPWIEETREFFGLLIVLGTLLINRMYLKNRSTPAKPVTHA